MGQDVGKYTLYPSFIALISSVLLKNRQLQLEKSEAVSSQLEQQLRAVVSATPAY
jgi:hypothetical protein